MKVIDLLNKIANREEVPEIIKYRNSYYKFYERLRDFYNYKKIDINTMEYLDSYLEDEYFLTNILTGEVEIIEEDKEIEELRIKQEKNIKNNWKWKIEDTEHDYNISTPQKIMGEKINELIKAVNELKKGK